MSKERKRVYRLIVIMSSVLGEKISLVHCFVNSSSNETGGVVNKSVCTSVCDNMYVV